MFLFLFDNIGNIIWSSSKQNSERSAAERTESWTEQHDCVPQAQVAWKETGQGNDFVL